MASVEAATQAKKKDATPYYTFTEPDVARKGFIAVILEIKGLKIKIPDGEEKVTGLQRLPGIGKINEKKDKPRSTECENYDVDVTLDGCLSVRAVPKDPTHGKTYSLVLQKEDIKMEKEITDEIVHITEFEDEVIHIYLKV